MARLPLRGLAFAMGGSIAWGFSGTCAQYLLANESIPSLVLCTIRLLGAGCILLAFCAACKKPAPIREMFASPARCGHMAFFGIVGVFMAQLTYLETIARTNAGTATMIGCLSAVMLLVVVCAKSHRAPRIAEGAGILLALAATWFIAVGGDINNLAISPEALAWGLANAAVITAYTLQSKPLMARWGSIQTVAVGMIVGGVVCVLFAIPQWSFPPLDLMGWGALAVMVLVGTCLSYCLFFQAILLLSPVDIGMLQAVEPVAATVFSAVLLGTVFSTTDYIGFTLMIAMVILVALAGKEDTKSPEKKGADR